jgi:hypothetical protein
VKDPKRVRRTREVARQLAVTGRKERDNARDVRPYFSFREGPAVDMPNDHDARLRIDQFGRQAHRMRSDAGRPLAIAEDMVGWNISAATRDIALSPVIDDECRVGKPSVQRFELHLAAPAWQGGNSCFEIDRHHPVRKREFGAVTARDWGLHLCVR